jgi:hypothetical protein
MAAARSLSLRGTSMNRTPSFSAVIDAFGAVRLAMAEIAPLRKKLPPWVPTDTAGHFLKYADEQSVAAVAAVDRAIQGHGVDLNAQRDWPIIAAPRFFGRVAGPGIISGYDRGGPQAVSPQVIPQHSLHSMSGALSILLGSRGPNAGVGGGPESLDDAILAAFSLPGADAPGLWLVATAWDPEPVVDRGCRLLNEPVCHAFALSLRKSARSAAPGELCLQPCRASQPSIMMPSPPMSVSRIVGQLSQLASGGEFRLAWTLAWGAEVELSVRAAQQRLRLAA